VDPLLLAKWLGICLWAGNHCGLRAQASSAWGRRSGSYVAPALWQRIPVRLAGRQWPGNDAGSASSHALPVGATCGEGMARRRSRIFRAGRRPCRVGQAGSFSSSEWLRSSDHLARGRSGARIGLWLRRGLWFLMVFGLYVGFRIAYYGRWLPNTYSPSASLSLKR
jgi:hypothetical protein